MRVKHKFFKSFPSAKAEAVKPQSKYLYKKVISPTYIICWLY